MLREQRAARATRGRAGTGSLADDSQSDPFLQVGELRECLVCPRGAQVLFQLESCRRQARILTAIVLEEVGIVQYGVQACRPLEGRDLAHHVLAGPCDRLALENDPLSLLSHGLDVETGRKDGHQQRDSDERQTEYHQSRQRLGAGPLHQGILPRFAAAVMLTRDASAAAAPIDTTYGRSGPDCRSSASNPIRCERGPRVLPASVGLRPGGALRGCRAVAR